MLRAFFEACVVVSTALLTGLRAIAKKTSNTRRGIGCLPFDRRENEQREQWPSSVLSHHLSSVAQAIGTFETDRPMLLMSVHGGRPEVIGASANRRD
jgi:hypothetical protein